MARLSEILEANPLIPSRPEGVFIHAHQCYDPLPSGIDGVFFRNVEYWELQKMRNYDQTELVGYVFVKILCDNKGDLFSDIVKQKDIDKFPLMVVSKIMQEFFAIWNTHWNTQELVRW